MNDAQGNEIIYSPDLRCLTCGAVRVEVAYAESHGFTHCHSCGALGRPDQVALYNRLMREGQYTPHSPHLQGTCETLN